MKFRWIPAAPRPDLCEILARELGISPLLAQCLINRGFDQVAATGRFLEPRLRDLADPFLIPNMRAAVERLFAARERNEPLVIFGDYDVDGVTATALLGEVLNALGWKAGHYLPHRRDEGYGLSQSGVENCLAKFPTTLLLAVDCGSTSNATIDWLHERGVDVVVLDHHQVSDPPPTAVALVNPHLHPASAVPGSDFTELCSAGLAFKLAHALVKHGRQTGMPGAAEFDLKPCLDLVALGAIADLVPLRDENRMLVNIGLQRLNVTKRPGLLSLMEVAGIRGPVGGYEVAYQLAPRLNAAGRMETAEAALQLLTAPDRAQADPLSQSLDASNRERQQVERQIVDEVIAAVRARFNPGTDFVIVEGQPGWHLGVVGIVASRVLQEFYRPTIILGGDGLEWRGSGRSVEGFDLAAALNQCDDFLLRHGGHAMAAGVTLSPANVDAFRDRLNGLARDTLQPEQLQPRLRLDAEAPLQSLTLERVQELGRLQQTGMGNPQVQLFARHVTHARPCQRMGADRRHARLWVTDGATTIPAVLWGAGANPLPSGAFDLAFVPQLNTYNGSTQVQLKVLDWRPAEN